MTLGVIGDPSVVDRTLISALRYPNVAAIACGAWTVGRILYTFGYTSEAPEKVSERHAVCVGGPLGLLSFMSKWQNLLGSVMANPAGWYVALLLSSTYTASQLVK